MDKEIVKEAKRIEESAKYAAETQFEYAKTWRRLDRVVAAASAMLAAIAGVGSLSDVLGSAVAGVVAILAAGAAAVAASLGAPQTKEKAAGSANQYRALQQDTRIFLSITGSKMNSGEQISELTSLKDRLQDLHSTAVIPSDKAWKKAKKQVEDGSQDYEVDS